MDNLEVWNKLNQPPKTALRTIVAGRLKGKTDINPQWRYQAMTEQFGMCGVGWRYDALRVWAEPATDGQVFAFAEISLQVKQGDTWSEGIPGIGGSMLVTKESSGLHSSDEGYKMAITDALSVAMKMLGVAADVYAGLWDGTKYTNAPQKEEGKAPQKEPVQKAPDGMMTDAQRKKIYASAKEKWNLPNEEVTQKIKLLIQERFGLDSSKDMTVQQASDLIEEVEASPQAVTATPEPPKPKGRVISRDADKILTWHELTTACKQDFNMKPEAVLAELNAPSWADITDTAADCYKKIAAVRK